MKTQYLTIGNKKLAYDDAGNGSLVICMPSLGDIRSEYRYLVPKLVKAGYRAVTMDLRGMGESSAFWDSYSVSDMGSDVLKLIQHLDAGPAVVIGTSKSAGSAIWAAAEGPKLVKGIILISPVARDITDMMPVWLAKIVFTVLFLPPWGGWVWKKYYPTLYPAKKTADFDSYLSNLTDNLKEPGRLASIRKMTTSSNRASEERFGNVSVPVRIIMGSKDPDFKIPEKEAKYLSQFLKGDYHIIAGAGHYPQAEMPEITGPMILEFINSLNHHKENNVAQSRNR